MIFSHPRSECYCQSPGSQGPGSFDILGIISHLLHLHPNISTRMTPNRETQIYRPGLPIFSGNALRNLNLELTDSETSFQKPKCGLERPLGVNLVITLPTCTRLSTNFHINEVARFSCKSTSVISWKFRSTDLVIYV